MDAGKIGRTLARLALEIVEKNKGTEDLALVGIRTRGVPLAERLARLIGEAEKRDPPPVGVVDITLYRDDLTSIAETPTVRSTAIPFRIAAKTVVLVDDVLFTGRTIRAAIDEVLDYGRPRAMRLAVLVDRGHRELPIQADYVGKVVPTRLTERVDVKLSEIDGLDEVVIDEAPSQGKPARRPARSRSKEPARAPRRKPVRRKR